MKFRITIEHYAKDQDSGVRYWSHVLQRDIKISAAELASRQVEKIVAEEGLTVDANVVREILFKELGEDEE